MTGPDGFVAVDQLPAGFYVVRVDAKRNHFAKPTWIRLTRGSTHHLEIDVRHKSERKRKAGNKGYSKPKS